MTAPLYGIKYAAGGYTGGITDQYRLAAAYAKDYHGTVYTVGGPDDPEVTA